MRILVTGGAGFIGSHLVDRLLGEGHSVVAVDDFSSGARDNLPDHPELRIVNATIGDSMPDGLPPSIEAAVHLAAQPSVTASWETPVETHHRNLTSTVTVLDYCRRNNIPRFVLASSAAVYGSAENLPVDENSQKTPLAPYGLQKLASEEYARLFAAHGGMISVALRFFNVYGPRQNPDSPYSGVISKFAAAMRTDEPITIHGDGLQSRDFIFVEDIVSALIAAISCDLIHRSFVPINVGTGRATSLLDLVDLLRNEFPTCHVDVRHTSSRAGDIRHSTADIRLAEEVLGFSPKWALSDGLHKLVSAS